MQWSMRASVARRSALEIAEGDAAVADAPGTAFGGVFGRSLLASPSEDGGSAAYAAAAARIDESRGPRLRFVRNSVAAREGEDAAASFPVRTLDLTDPSVALTPTSATSLVIAAGAMTPRSTYVFVLTATDLLGQTSSAVFVVVAAGAPRGANGAPFGNLSVTPSAGVGLSTVFRMSTAGWAQETLPLLFQFGYVVAGQEALGVVPMTDFLPLATAAHELPSGSKDLDSGVTLYVVAQNSAGAQSPPTAVGAPVRVTARVFQSPDAVARFVDSKVQDIIRQAAKGQGTGALTNVGNTAQFLNDPASSTFLPYPPPPRPPPPPPPTPPPRLRPLQMRTTTAATRRRARVPPMPSAPFWATPAAARQPCRW